MLLIPDSVTKIGDQVFWGCSGLRDIAIPKSVTAISTDSFAWCGGLRSIGVDGANPAYSSDEDGVLFDKQRTRLVRYPGGKTGNYDIPDSVKSISDGAFVGCANLISITIPNSVTNIGGWAFPDCSSLSSVMIPKSVNSIGAISFINCRKLCSFVVDEANPAYSSCEDGVLFDKEKTCLVNYPAGKAGSYEIPSGVSKIGRSAFQGCPNMTTVTIPESVTSIGPEAFRGCDKLTTIHFKGDAPSLEKDVFLDCKSATVYHEPGAKGWGKEFGGRLTVPWNSAATRGAIPLPSKRLLKASASDGAGAK